MTRSCVGYFGGTFDPIHFGHLRVALDLKQRLSLDAMSLVPCFIPPHRTTPGVDAQARLEMVQQAVIHTPSLTVDDRELRRNAPSYTFDTLASVRNDLGADTSIVWCMGMDSLLSLPSWHRWSELLTLAHVLVVSRPGYDLPVSGELASWVDTHRRPSSELRASAQGGLFIETSPLLPISATEIRQQLAEGFSPQFLMPDQVLTMIRERGYYHAPRTL